MKSSYRQRLIDGLIAEGIIPEEALKEVGEQGVLSRIQRAFPSESRREWLNPHYVVGKKMREDLEGVYWSQQYLCKHLELSYGIRLGQSALSRILWGKQVLSYMEGVAIARLLGVPDGAFFPEVWATGHPTAAKELSDPPDRSQVS